MRRLLRLQCPRVYGLERREKKRFQRFPSAWAPAALSATAPPHTTRILWPHRRLEGPVQEWAGLSSLSPTPLGPGVGERTVIPRPCQTEQGKGSELEGSAGSRAQSPWVRRSARAGRRQSVTRGERGAAGPQIRCSQEPAADLEPRVMKVRAYKNGNTADTHPSSDGRRVNRAPQAGSQWSDLGPRASREVASPVPVPVGHMSQERGGPG